MPGWYISGFERPRGPTAIGAGAAAYVGPGDIFGSAFAWWGLRAFSAATIGQNLIQVRRASDSATQDFASLASGAFDTASLTTFLNATTGKVSKFYDQSGNGRDLVEVNSTVSAPINISPLYVTVDTGVALTTTSNTLNQPYSISAVFFPVISTTGDSPFLFALAGSGVQIGFNDTDGTGNNTFGMFAAATSTTSSPNKIPATSYAAEQALANGASSKIYLDGNQVTVDAGAVNHNDQMALSATNATNQFRECGFWSGDKSASFSSMNSNQHAFWSF